MSTEKKDPPIAVHRDGQTFIKVWRNWLPSGDPSYSSTTGYTYTDKETGQARESRSLRDSDLLRLPELAPLARQSIRQFREADRAQSQSQAVGNGQSAPQQGSAPSQNGGGQPQQGRSEQQRFRQSRQQPSSQGQGYNHEP